MTDICAYCGLQITCELPSDVNCGYFIPYGDENEEELEEVRKIIERNQPTEKMINDLIKDLGC
jgi:hypothetical protein